MLTRREFHKTLSGLILTSLASAPIRAAAATDQAGLSDAAFLNRLSFGATADERGELARLGREGWLESQLTMPARDAGLSGRFATAGYWIEYEAGTGENGEKWDAVAEYRPLTSLDKSPEELVHLLSWDEALDFSERARPLYEVIAASLIRAVHAPAQLREVMTQFWHEHFSVYGDKDEVTAALFPPYDALLRENALGNFRVLLGQVARSPAMLHYLNNDSSAASPANENYARELLELHTLGQENYFNDLYDSWEQVPGARDGLATGYIDDDVYEVARALTGWSIGDGRDYGEDRRTPVNGRFAYVEAWHDPYQKRVLGVELPAFSGPEEDGDRVLDILAAHPGTAHFVSGKMLRRLGIESPSPEYHAAMARSFTQHKDADDQIAQVIRAIVRHPEFEATPPIKLRLPFEFLASVYRATGVQVSPRNDQIFGLLQSAGWAQHMVRPPTGHSDKTEDWADTRTINGMVELVLNAHDEWVEVTDSGLDVLPPGLTTMGDLVAHWETRMSLAPGSLAGALQALDASPDEDIPEDPDDLGWYNGILMASAAIGPENLYR